MDERRDKAQRDDTRHSSTGTLNGLYKESNGHPITSPYTSGTPQKPGPNNKAISEALSERSPLIAAKRSMEGDRLPRVMSPLAENGNDDHDGDEEEYGDYSYQEDHGEESKSTWHLFLLTLTIGGLQIAWSVELAYGSPYLLSLGITKSLLAFVWVAGPLSGTLVQPYVGIKSDNCRIRWGRRKPFMIGGAIATVISLLALAWAREIVGTLLHLFGVAKESQTVRTVAIVLAVTLIYVLDFAINVIQAAFRALIVDCTPTHQQEAANAWANRISGVGNILGYLSGYINLPKIMPFFGNSQFKVLCAIASMTLSLTLAITCAAVSEMDPRLRGEPSKQGRGVLLFFKNLYNSTKRLPHQIQNVCKVQFFAWIGWFPFLFYITTYVGEIYADPYFSENPDLTEDEVHKIWDKGTQVGSLALLIFAITSFVFSVILPLLIVPTFKAPTRIPATPLTSTTPLTNSMSSSGYFPVQHSSKTPTRSLQPYIKSRLADLATAIQIPSLTLPRAWLFSHLLFTFITSFLTFLVRTPLHAIILVALIGIPWSMTNWAPYALIASEISKRDAIRRHLIPAPPTQDGELLASGEDDGEAQGGDEAGVVLGIHNVAIAAPQMISTVISSVVFRYLQKPRGVPGDTSVAWVLRLGGLSALVAAWLTTRIGEEREERERERGNRLEGS